ncbi:MAG: hypothetical protein J6K32_06845 [Clostridia bacterium]|nr:hypothetical protein [Clostridia bacterium]
MIGVGIYVKDSPSAAALYQAAFGLTLGYHVLNKDGTYFHSEFHRGGEPFCSVVEARQETLTDRQPVELGVEFDSRDALEHAFTLLSDGGHVDMEIGELPWSPCAAMVRDRYGVRWFLSMPQHRPADGWSPDDEA